MTRSGTVQVPTTEAVKGFWAWFYRAAPNLAKDFFNTGLLHELDVRLSTLGPVSWELGPGRIAPNSLTISPDGRSALLDLTRRIVSHAPEVPEWEFHSAKPPKQWDLRFSLQVDCGTEVEIDAREWEYVLYAFPDGVLDIDILAPGLAPYGDDICAMATELAIEGQLGEAERLERVGRIKTVTNPDEDLRGKASSIRFLSDHISSLPRFPSPAK